MPDKINRGDDNIKSISSRSSLHSLRFTKGRNNSRSFLYISCEVVCTKLFRMRRMKAGYTRDAGVDNVICVGQGQGGWWMASAKSTLMGWERTSVLVKEQSARHLREGPASGRGRVKARVEGKGKKVRVRTCCELRTEIATSIAEGGLGSSEGR